MPRLGYMIVDGLAFALVGVGLTAAAVGYARNLPDPAESRAAAAEVASTWADPETTGSVAPKDGGRGATGRSAWIDPPRR